MGRGEVGSGLSKGARWAQQKIRKGYQQRYREWLSKRLHALRMLRNGLRKVRDARFSM
jgi:hypothetical protein